MHPAAAARPPREAEAIALSERLLAWHLHALEERFGARALGLADLPPLTGDTIEPDQLRVVPPLFWAREVEGAGLLEVVDALAQGVMRGTIIEPIGDAVDDLVTYWRDRNERFTPDERRAIYSHLFGGDGSPDPNEDFEALWNGIVDALAEIGVAPVDTPLAHLQARVGVLVEELAASLSPRTAGVTAFAARGIVAQIKTSLGILGGRELAAAFGGGGPWTLVARLAPRLLGRSLDPTVHISRATAGLRVLTWVVTDGIGVDGGVPGIRQSDPVALAALDWQAASGVGG